MASQSRQLSGQRSGANWGGGELAADKALQVNKRRSAQSPGRQCLICRSLADELVETSSQCSSLPVLLLARSGGGPLP